MSYDPVKRMVGSVTIEQIEAGAHRRAMRGPGDPTLVCCGEIQSRLGQPSMRCGICGQDWRYMKVIGAIAKYYEIIIPAYRWRRVAPPGSLSLVGGDNEFGTLSITLGGAGALSETPT